MGEPGGSLVELYLASRLAEFSIEWAGGHAGRAAEPARESASATEPESDAEPEPDSLAELDAAAQAGSELGEQPEATAPESVADAGAVVDADLSDAELIDRLKDTAAQVAALQAALFCTAAEFARRRTSLPGREGEHPAQAVSAQAAPSEFAADEVAAALTLTRWSADRLLDDATRLTSTLPETLDALAQGRTDLVRARMVCRATAGLSEDAASAVDEAVADRLPTSTTTQLKDVLAAEVIAVDPGPRPEADGAGDRGPVGDVLAGRRRSGRAGRDGRAARGRPGPRVLDLMDALTALATRSTPECPTGRGIDAGPDGEPRGVDARRFDALVDLAGRAASGLPGAASRKPAVQVTVALTTLLAPTSTRATWTGTAPVTAGLARQIAKKGTLRRLLTDPVTGVVVGVDSHTHSWDESLDRHGPDDGAGPPGDGPHGDDSNPGGVEDSPPGGDDDDGPPHGGGGRPPDDPRGNGGSGGVAGKGGRGRGSRAHPRMPRARLRDRRCPRRPARAPALALGATRQRRCPRSYGGRRTGARCPGGRRTVPARAGPGPAGPGPRRALRRTRVPPPRRHLRR